MTEKDQVIQWLREGHEDEAVKALEQCDLEISHVDTMFNFNSREDIDIFDVKIKSRRKLLDQVRDHSPPFVAQIDKAIRVCLGEDLEIREISWIAQNAADQSPASFEIQNRLNATNSKEIHQSWQRIVDRRLTDPEGAITMARTLLEATCKHILDECAVDYNDKMDLTKLYRLTATELNLSPSQHAEQIFKQILGGCQTVVLGLGSLRNKIGDAHAQGKRRVKLAPRHVELAANLAGTMAAFLIATWEERSK